jgi:LmbE family N-acetylglucosaminyl deacetylase
VHRRLLPVGLTLFIPLFFLPARLAGQLEPPSSGGAIALDQELRMLGHYKRVLMIGAHPDDEDTELLTVLVRGMGAEAAYLSLNRGEGGQNLIGTELGEALGLIRTEELLAARRLDGARQYFTRAYDFGYSKSIDETWQHWPRDEILQDVVRVVRKFRPQIIVSIFSGTARDGHGQHQAAGSVAQEAFRVAGDSTGFRELAGEGLVPWSPLKLYRSARFDTAATTLVLDGGVLDPAVGKSFHQIAMAGRSLHRSQDMGQLQQIGPSSVRLALVEDRTGAGAAGLFAGIDTTMAAMPLGERRRIGGPAGLVRRSHSPPSLHRYLARIDSVSVAAGRKASHSRMLLARAARDLEESALETPQADSTDKGLYYTRGVELYDQLGHLNAARWHLSRVVFDAILNDDRVVAGQALRWTLSSWNASADPRVVQMSATQCIPMGDCHAPDVPDAHRVEPGQVDSVSVNFSVLDEQPPTTPYFLRAPRVGDLYTWPERAPSHVLGPLPYGDPFEPPEFVASSELAAAPTDSVEAGHWTEAVFRFNDQARGEVRRPVTVVPRVDVKLDPASELWPLPAVGSRRFTVTLTHGARDSTAGSVGLRLPRGWPPVQPQRFQFTREDERSTFTFEVKPPAKLTPDSIEVRAVARDSEGATYDIGVYTVDYPHIRPRSYTRFADATIRIAPLVLPKLTRVGYVRGAADRVPAALQSVGIPLTLLSAAMLERGNLDRYDAIVVGPRAYETDSALVDNNRRLLEYVRRGGLLIVQYQQHRFFNGRFAPYPMQVGGPPLQLDVPQSGRTARSAPARPTRPISHDRVADESAPVRIVTADHPVVRGPNRLTSADWNGWVQERGLYFARSWDRRYQPVLETHDPGEAALEGGLLVARVGKGTYVYTGLSFFRQLPAGVPGAFRLFANLLALAHGR